MSRGYSTPYKPGYYHGGRSSSYLSSIQEVWPSSGGGAGSRGTTPVGRSTSDGPSVGLSMLADAISGSNSRKASREARNYGLSSSLAPAAYKYFARSDFYNPSTILFNHSGTRGTATLAKRECMHNVLHSNYSIQNI